MILTRKAVSILGLFITMVLSWSVAVAGTFVVDLTHPIGTFAPKGGDIATPDVSKPLKGSIQVPTFGAPAVYEVLPDFKTNRGHFGLGRFVLMEHHGTHIDAPFHYQNNKSSLETKTPDLRTMEELTANDLMGPIVFIDISGRVQSELDKNGGKPGSKAVTDFSNSSNNLILRDAFRLLKSRS